MPRVAPVDVLVDRARQTKGSSHLSSATPFFSHLSSAMYESEDQFTREALEFMRKNVASSA
jgi:hypothetical protein